MYAFIFYFIIISQSMMIRKTHHASSLRISGCQLLKAAGTKSKTCLTMHGGPQDDKFLVTHPITFAKIA
jgi:hypothetical protein